jgi:hypothetical protein
MLSSNGVSRIKSLGCRETRLGAQISVRGPQQQSAKAQYQVSRSRFTDLEEILCTAMLQ